jgi:hypothetical protein
MASTVTYRSGGDAILVALAAVHAAVLIAWPVAPLIGVGVWWNANTISHNFIHRPFFRSPGLNRMFSAALSLLLGIPQMLWRDRHLAHHAGVQWRLRVSARMAFEALLVAGLWVTLAWFAPHFFLLVYLPGYLVGLALCAMQGYWEHAGGQPVSHYGRIYNFLCFNDGYHAEHHAAPGTHWTKLARRSVGDAAESSWPALFRWLDVHPLELLERLVLRSPRLQRFVLRKHKQAFEALLPQVQAVHRATVVGGGLYPRTALILGQLLPGVRLTIVDSEPRNIESARGMLSSNIEWRAEQFSPGEALDCDLAVVPLCLHGNRAEVYAHPPSAAVLVHDWIWHRRGTGAVVSVALLKRINLVRA